MRTYSNKITKKRKQIRHTTRRKIRGGHGPKVGYVKNADIQEKNKHDILEAITNIQHFEGPIYAALLEPTDKLKHELGRVPPVLLITADYHWGVDHGVRACKIKKNTDPTITYESMYMSANNVEALAKSNVSESKDIPFLKTLQTWHATNHWNIDVFFENWKYALNEKALIRSIHKSSLRNMIYATAKNQGRKIKEEEKMHKGLRIHATDTRKITTPLFDQRKPHYEKYLAERLPFIIREYIEFYKTIIDDVKDIELLKETLKNKFMTLFEDGTTIQSIIDYMKLIEDSDTKLKDVFKNEFYQKNSRSYHELQQLPEKTRDTLIEQFSAFYGEGSDYIKDSPFFIKNPSLLEPCITSLSTFIRTFDYNDIKDNIIGIIEILSVLVRPLSFFLMSYIEIYTLSRVLKTFKDGYPSQLAFINQGTVHNNMYITVLLKAGYYKIKQEWGDLRSVDTSQRQWNNTVGNKPLAYTIERCIAKTNISSFEPINIWTLDKLKETMAPKEKAKGKDGNWQFSEANLKVAKQWPEELIRMRKAVLEQPTKEYIHELNKKGIFIPGRLNSVLQKYNV